jgi:hypothetical protein
MRRGAGSAAAVKAEAARTATPRAVAGTWLARVAFDLSFMGPCSLSRSCHLNGLATVSGHARVDDQRQADDEGGEHRGDPGPSSRKFSDIEAATER